MVVFVAWIGGVCRRSSLHQLELTACCWPFSLEGYNLLMDISEAIPGALSRGWSRPCDRMRFSCLFRFGWAQQPWVGLELLGLTDF